MKDTDFYSRLYSGFEAEHFVAGKFFGAGLEGFKLPADFGFDLLVSNQKETSIGANAAIKRVFPFPYAIQVKSRRITDAHFGGGPNGRTEATINFRISKSEFELLSTEERSYLVCVAFPPSKDSALGDQVLYYWLRGTSKNPRFVIPANAGIQINQQPGHRLCRCDVLFEVPVEKPVNEYGVNNDRGQATFLDLVAVIKTKNVVSPPLFFISMTCLGRNFWMITGLKSWTCGMNFY
jgi:hypothetical protein